MAEWCMEHPWMTFFLLMTLFSSSIKIGPSSSRKLLRAEARIHELEEIICPCEQHDWLLVQIFDDEDGKQRQRSVCSRCKKEKVV